MRPEIVFDSSARLLVLVHTASAVVLIGSSTHHLVVALGYARGTCKVRLGRVYAGVVAASYGLTYLLGALAYPTYRYQVRALYLDRYAVWAANLFDFKENLATIGLPLALGAFVVSRPFDPQTQSRLAAPYLFLVLGVTAIVWFNFFSGLLVTMTKGL